MSQQILGGGEQVQARAGDFYNGRITRWVVGPFKGAPSTWSWEQPKFRRLGNVANVHSDLIAFHSRIPLQMKPCELAMNSTHVRLDHLDHVAFQVSNLSAALAWYRDLFSVKTLYEDNTWAMLSFENINLALVSQGEHPPHIALERSDATSFGPLTRHRDGTASVYIHDPTGNTIEIIQNVDPSEEQNGS